MLKLNDSTLSFSELGLSPNDDDFPNLALYSHIVDVKIRVINHLEVGCIEDGQVGVVNGYAYDGYETDYDEDDDMHSEIASGMEREMDQEDFEILVGEALRDLNDEPPEFFSPLDAAVDLFMLDEDQVVDLLLQEGQLEAAVAGLMDVINNHDWDDITLSLVELGREETRAALVASTEFQARLTGVLADCVANRQLLPFTAAYDLVNRAGNIAALELLVAHPAVPLALLRTLAQHAHPGVQTAAALRLEEVEA